MFLAVLLLAGFADGPRDQLSQNDSKSDQAACEAQAKQQVPGDPKQKTASPVTLPPIDEAVPAVPHGISPPPVTYNKERTEDQRLSAYNSCMEAKGHKHSRAS
jgi:hypothetical protein